MEIIQENLVGDKKLDKTILMQGALKGMIETLEDPHSNYFSKKGMEDLEGQMKGEYSGVGMIIRKGANEPVTVELLIEGAPAFNAGIRPNDKVLYIDGKSTYDIELEEASRLLKGDAGTEVKLKIYRESEKKDRDIVLKRADIKLENVRSKMGGGNIGYIKLTQFAENVDKEVGRELDKLISQGMEGLILDLRNNPGGIIGQAVSISSMFIKEGVIVSERPKKGEEVFSYREGKYYGDFPLVVLINGGSASASEIVSGAFKDNKRGILVGEKTFGKGSVQTLIPLPDGDGMKLTIAKYYTPSGICIHGIGIEPDVKVVEKEGYLLFDSMVTNIDENESKENKKELIKEIKGEEAAKEFENHKDIQLDTAVGILKGILINSNNK